MTEWFGEAETPDGIGLKFSCDAILCERRTEYQKLSLVQSPKLGRVLLLDGIVQLSERDEFVYHEMIVHVPMLAHGAVRRALVIGGGDGGTLRELLRHPLEQVTMVEIDREVVEICREYLPSVSGGAFDDPRVELLFDDGVRFVEESASERRYDLIIVDSTDPYPAGPGAVLFSESFYDGCRRLLGDSGVIVTQQGCPFLYPDTVRAAHARLAACFADAALYIAALPAYSGGYTAFGWATMDPDLRRQSTETLRERLARGGLDLRFYTPEFHHAAFVLPGTLKALVG